MATAQVSEEKGKKKPRATSKPSREDRPVGVQKHSKQTMSSANKGSKNKTAWQKVKVADDMLLGSTEYGFMGLEEFKPEAGSIVTPDSFPSSAPDNPKAASSEPAQPEQAGKRKRVKAVTSLAGKIASLASSKASGPIADANGFAQDHPDGHASDQQKKKSRKRKPQDDAATAPAELGQAEQPAVQNDDALLSQQPQKQKAKLTKPPKAAVSHSKPDAHSAGQKAKKNKALASNVQLKQQAAAAASQGKSASGDASTELNNKPSAVQAGQRELPPNAWQQFELHRSMEAALLAQGFSHPTPIQEACLMPAVRGRCDVIGAAQTVRSLPWQVCDPQQECTCFLPRSALLSCRTV